MQGLHDSIQNLVWYPRGRFSGFLHVFWHLVRPQPPAAQRRPGGPPIVRTGLTLALHRYRVGAESGRRPGTVAVLVFLCMSPGLRGGGGLSATKS